MEDKQILLIGFGDMETELKKKLEAEGLAVRAYGGSRLEETVGTLCMEKTEGPREPGMDRGLVLFHNFTQQELDPALKLLREAKLPKSPMKAMVTPTNWHWKISSLLKELQQEQELMGELMKLKALRDSMPLPAFTDLEAMKARMQAERQLSGGQGVTVDTIRNAYRELQKFQK